MWDTPDVETLPRHAARVTLRRLSSADLPAFQSYRHDPELARYQSWAPMSDAEALAFLVAMNAVQLFRPGCWTQIGIAERLTQRLIGDIGLFLSDDGLDTELGVTLERRAHGRGLATEAVRQAIALTFECTKAERVLGITDARNSSSVRLLERVGMQKAESRRTEFRGETCEEYVYAMARVER